MIDHTSPVETNYHLVQPFQKAESAELYLIPCQVKKSHHILYNQPKGKISWLRNAITSQTAQLTL
jgi:hypothetical protein